MSSSRVTAVGQSSREPTYKQGSIAYLSREVQKDMPGCEGAA